MLKNHTFSPISLLTFFFAITLLFTACDKEDPIIPNEEELITTLTYTLAPNDGGDVVVLNFLDLDGDGGNDPTITGGTLEVNKTYTGSLELLNASESPAENITAEIQSEDEDHQFFFVVGDDSAAEILYADSDANGMPLGLQTTLNTTSVSNTTLTITLRHEPNKSASGVASGEIENAGGETDIQVTFPVNVQ